MRRWLWSLLLCGCTAGNVALPSTAPGEGTIASAARCDASPITQEVVTACVSPHVGEARCLEPIVAEYLKTHTTREALAVLQCMEDDFQEIREDCHPVS